MVSCDICGKEFKTTQGLRGHKNFVHGLTGSSKILPVVRGEVVSNTQHPVAPLATQQPLSSNLSTPVTTEQRLSQLEDRFAKLEHITGVRETSELEKLLGITDTPLTERVAQLTEQLKSEYVSRDTMETIASELTGVSESLHQEIANIYNKSASAIRESRESCENNLSKMERHLTTTANELHELSKTMKHIQESVQGNSASINQLNTKLVFFEHALSELENKIAIVKHLTRRVPTGEIVSIQLSDKREHHFREYKSKEGLTRSHRTTHDLILGDRWIDLAEPED